jgi:prepilin-type N-terminal cleavage/methylation domain-containing protein
MSRRGFTLIEVLLAIALIAMLSGSVFGFLWMLVGRQDLLHGRSLEAQAGGAFIERLESDVLCGLAGDDRAGAGVSGTTTNVKLLSRGVWLPASAGDQGGDLQASEYVFDSAARELRGRRWPASQSAPAFETISNHVERVRLRYFDGTAWQDSFDSLKSGGLPIAIEVGVWFGGAPESSGQSTTAAASGGQGTPDSKSAGTGQGTVREPDRLRVIVVPDGPVASWKETR